jgi:hypothetical protein
MVNTTAGQFTVKSNGSLTLDVSEWNPTDRDINLSASHSWYLPNMTATWYCYSGYPPFGFNVFRGYYDLQNVTKAENVVYSDTIPSCIYYTPYTSFLLKSGSIVSWGWQVYAIDGSRVRDPFNGGFVGVDSLRSSKPAVYTVAAGNEWGDLVLLHFRVT